MNGAFTQPPHNVDGVKGIGEALCIHATRWCVHTTPTQCGRGEGCIDKVLYTCT